MSSPAAQLLDLLGEVLPALDAAGLGIMTRLVEISWRRSPPCSLPDPEVGLHRQQLILLTRSEQAVWSATEPLVLAVWHVRLRSGAIHSPALRGIYDREAQRSRSLSAAGSRGAAARWLGDKAMARPWPGHGLAMARTAAPAALSRAPALDHREEIIPSSPSSRRGDDGDDGDDGCETPGQKALLEIGVAAASVLHELRDVDPELVRYAAAQHGRDGRAAYVPGRVVQALRSGTVRAAYEAELAQTLFAAQASQARSAAALAAERERQALAAAAIQAGRRRLKHMSQAELAGLIAQYRAEHGSARRYTDEQLAENESFVAFAGRTEAADLLPGAGADQPAPGALRRSSP